MQKNNSFFRGAFVWVLIVLMLFVVIRLAGTTGANEREVALWQFLSELESGKNANGAQLTVVRIRVDNLDGDEVQANFNDGTQVSFYLPPLDFVRERFLKRLDEAKVQVEYPRRDGAGSWASPVLLYFLPLVVVVALMMLMIRNMQGAGGKALSFGKSRAKLLRENATKVTFKNVAGVDEAKEDCADIIAFLRDHKKFHDIGARIPKGVLMMGPPGTGKTLLARAIAGEAGVPFFHISGSDFVEMFVGVGASRVRDLFEQAKKNAPCIVFIDEIDAVGRHRGTGVGGGHDEREQTLNQLLVEMDGFEANDAVIVVAATNRPDVLDPALLRPGRFDRRVIVNLPDVRGRKEILNVYVKRVKSVDNIDIEKVALGTPGFSGADLENLINEAALLAARAGGKVITMKDIEAAKDKILMGPERKSAVMSPEGLRVTAYHETGHALVSYFLKSRMNVHKFSIIPRGRALGVTVYLPREDIYTSTKEDLLTDIASTMGGRAAEEIKFGNFTTGASNDINQATEVARAMVCQYGMSELGPVNYGQKSGNPFLGRDWAEMRNYSDQIAFEIDKIVSTVIQDQYIRAKTVLEDNREVFERVAEILLQVETLDGDEFRAVVDGASLEEIRRIQEEKELQKMQEPPETPVTAATAETTPETSEVAKNPEATEGTIS